MTVGQKISDKDALPGVDDLYGIYNGTSGPIAWATLSSQMAATGATADAITAAVNGLTRKAPVVAVADSNVTLSGEQTVDGVAVAADDRVLLTGQTDAAENGIWVVSASSWSRATDADSDAEILTAIVFCTSGTTYGATTWICTGAPEVGTDDITFIPVAGLSSAVAVAAQAAAEDAEANAAVSATAAAESEISAAASAAATAASESGASASATAAAASESSAEVARDQAQLAALAAGADIVTSLTSPTPSNGTVELLQTGPGLQAYEVQTGAWVSIGWLGELLYDDAPAVLASTETGFASGQIIRTRREGIAYIVVTSDQDLTTAGGVKLVRIRDDLQGDFIPDTDGEGTPTTALSAILAGTAFTVVRKGRPGIGPMAGRMLYAGDVVQTLDGARPLVVVASGQSNMLGASQDGPGGTYRVNPDVLIWNHETSQFEVADLENDYYRTPTLNPIGNGNQNLAVSFAHRLQEQTGRRVYVIVAAQGGQPIEQWIGSGTASTIYAGMEAVIEARLAALGLSTIDFFLWHQGESNATEDVGSYRRKLAQLIDQLRAEPWFPADTPFIAGEPCPEWGETARRDYMIAEVNALLDRGDPHYFVARSAGLVGDGDVAYDDVHFSNASIEDLGYYRYWNALWRSETDIPVTVAPDATTHFTVSSARYEDREYAREAYVKQQDLRAFSPNTQWTRLTTPKYFEIESAGGGGVVNVIAKLLRPNSHGFSDLGGGTVAWKSLYLTSSIVQPGASDLNVIVNGVNLFGFRSDGSIRQRGSTFALFDEYGDGFNTLNFTGSDGALRGQITTTYSGLSGALRMSVTNTSGATLTAMRVNSDGLFRLPLAPASHTATSLPNVYMDPTSGGLKMSTASGLGQRVAVPSTATDAGQPGQFAADASHIYVYTGDGTTHTWVRSAAAAW